MVGKLEPFQELRLEIRAGYMDTSMGGMLKLLGFRAL